jgi:hypothetical protein
MPMRKVHLGKVDEPSLLADAPNRSHRLMAIRRTVQLLLSIVLTLYVSTIAQPHTEVAGGSPRPGVRTLPTPIPYPVIRNPYPLKSRATLCARRALFPEADPRVRNVPRPNVGAAIYRATFLKTYSFMSSFLRRSRTSSSGIYAPSAVFIDLYTAAADFAIRIPSSPDLKLINVTSIAVFFAP